MDTESTPTTIAIAGNRSGKAKALAEEQAAKDAQLMAELSARAELTALVAENEETAMVQRRRISHAERVRDAQNQAIIAALQMVPLNREQRRAQTKAFAAMLRTASRNA